ncbi:MAG TPA: inorganic phosphate transporter, partial [Phycisphaerae bacterium]|nr:inorganic phosphate transporter [Phycisphaerae bacterium]
MPVSLIGSLEPLLATVSYETLFVIGVVAVGMLLWDTIEVGRNDAANLVNAVFGARVLTRRTAVYLAGVAVVLGAAASSRVIDTVRNDIFDPTHFGIEEALSVYVAVYIVDTVLLYSYSAFGMPVSTTATLVFSLAGAAFALGGAGAVNWPTAGKVIAAIVCSIVITGIAAFFIQRMVRGAIRDRTKNLTVLLAHGSWIGGGMLAGLTYFMLVKGMKHVGFVKDLNQEFVQSYGPIVVLLTLWMAYGIIIHALLATFGRRAARRLFPALAIIGTFAMAFAFGQNDLANCAAPGLAALNLIRNRDAGVAAATQIPITVWALAGCGLLMALGMMTHNAQRVTSAAVHAGSMAHQVRLWAPGWCIGLARFLLRFRRRRPVLAPLPEVTPAGKTMHYDALRACVILAVSASVIATASGFALPVSTTYVAFAAVVATGMADRILQRGDAELKLARTIWVVFSWFAASVIGAVCAGGVCLLVYKALVYGGGPLGIVIGIGANLTIRHVLKRRADAQERRVREAADERMHPELYAEEY